MSFVLLLLSVLHGGPIGAATEPQKETITIDGRAAACLLNHRRAYEADARDVLVIYLDLCPIARPTQTELSRLNTNQSVNIHRGNTARNRNVLVLSKREFGCLIRDLQSRRNLARQRAVSISSACIAP
ncbi:hypothetical protein [Sphingomonas kyeonggiensis]|uniref:Uncharacterized protein n=1 Tax=Sphingomonas kyeonggiensis TaxID=1268553 RepID=A0A7W6NVZ1_9SPHN|nr:hypothetical protein [Sphingomonas kyeonggiensis]MBB4097628.1 hypothetical protein [Sphingomonas kyeonggiensis]